MHIDYDTATTLREQHPAWRLLSAQNAPLVVAFLSRVFVEANAREIRQSDLVEALEDDLLALRRRFGDDRYPRAARAYLDDWASADHGWLRKYYVASSDEPRFDLTAPAEKAVRWLATLTARSFVGTESRLLTLFDLLRQMHYGSQVDPDTRRAHLQQQRDILDTQIAEIESGRVPVLDDTELRDRFQQFLQTSGELLGDFRHVEQNFRDLDRGVREQIATWTDSRGELLAGIIGERDAIGDSDQGRNFAAFWDYLMSSTRQQELSTLLDEVLALDAIASLDPDPRTRRLHYDWLDAGEHAQRTVARLSKQLRHFLDDQTWLENRRIMEIIRDVEASSVAIRSTPPSGPIMEIELPVAAVNLPMERPLAAAQQTIELEGAFIDLTEEDVDDEALFTQFVVDKAELESKIRRVLQGRSQVSLGELTELEPIEQGLAELIAYLELAHSSFDAVIDDATTETITWVVAASVAHRDPNVEPPDVGAADEPLIRRARVPRVVFVGAR